MTRRFQSMSPAGSERDPPGNGCGACGGEAAPSQVLIQPAAAASLRRVGRPLGLGQSSSDTRLPTRLMMESAGNPWLQKFGILLSCCVLLPMVAVLYLILWEGAKKSTVSLQAYTAAPLPPARPPVLSLDLLAKFVCVAPDPACGASGLGGSAPARLYRGLPAARKAFHPSALDRRRAGSTLPDRRAASVP